MSRALALAKRLREIAANPYMAPVHREVIIEAAVILEQATGKDDLDARLTELEEWQRSFNDSYTDTEQNVCDLMNRVGNLETEQEHEP